MTECVKKKAFSALFYPPLFVCFLSVVSTSLFFVHSGFLGIKEKEGTFLYTRTRAQKKKNVFSESFFKEREREREKKRAWGRKRYDALFRFDTTEKEE